MTHDLPASLAPFAVSLPTATVATLWGDDPQTGNAIYRSTNGGVNRVIEQFTVARDVRDVVMFGETTGVAVGRGAIFRRQ